MGQTLPQPHNIACSAFCDTLSFSPINWICFNLRILPKIRKMTRLMWISSNFSTMGSKLKNPLDRTQCYHVLSNCTLPFVQNGSSRRGRTEHLTRVKLPYKSSLCCCMCQNCDKSTWILIWKYIFGGFVSWFSIGFKNQDIRWNFDDLWSIHWYRAYMEWNQITRPKTHSFEGKVVSLLSLPPSRRGKKYPWLPESISRPGGTISTNPVGAWTIEK